MPRPTILRALASRLMLGRRGDPTLAAASLLIAAATAAAQIAFVPAFLFNGDGAGDGFGRSVSGAGDVNNDGFDDLIVGAWGDDNNGLNAGSARVFITSVRPCPGDADANGTVNFADITNVLKNFNLACP